MSLKTLLERSGLTNYQQKLFFTVLRHPLETAKKLAKISKVPLGRIYTELDALEHLGFIESTSTRPKRYHMESVRTKVITLLEQEQQKLDILEKESLEELGQQEVGAEVFHLAPEIKQSQIHTFRWAKDEVCQCLGIIHKSSENRDIKSIYEREIISAVNRGVVFYALYSAGQRPPENLLKLAQDKPDFFQMRFSELPIPRFDIVDTNQILFKIQDPLDTSTTVGTIVISNLSLARKLRSKFMNLWDESKTKLA
jgi:sugar-specific transcriptional regulator TrmB